MPGQTYQGGCLCGRIRYRATGEPQRPHYCHCRMCQRGVGAPLTAWVNFPLAGFAWAGGFCAICGAAICTIADGDDYVCITLASLDDPERISPTFHMWTSSAVSWLKVDDQLPRHKGQG